MISSKKQQSTLSSIEENEWTTEQSSSAFRIKTKINHNPLKIENQNSNSKNIQDDKSAVLENAERHMILSAELKVSPDPERLIISICAFFANF